MVILEVHSGTGPDGKILALARLPGAWCHGL